MKRAVVFLLILIFSISITSAVFADMNEKIGNHWSGGQINRDFLLYYFPYLAKENFKRLSPEEPINEDEFLLSFSSLLKEKGYTPVEVGWKTALDRIEMVRIIGEKLAELEVVEFDTKDMPFIDIDGITESQRQALSNLYSIGIIDGQSNAKFNPYAKITQAEAIIVLQRINNLLDNIANDEHIDEPGESREPEEIPFTLSGIIQSYFGKEGINTRIQEDKGLVTATKMFPTPGYSVEVEKITKDNGEYKIYLDITPPDEESILPQVITYKTITMEIDKQYLGNPPYNFVWGNFFKLK
ncbi:protease complex subunit PrcB family protein [Schnuerera sp. xch1]|uniref:protease complex subunit PrcB family protein n=1 Tax=Schnuerera sp. xch1 TaxID=2874283 RepID=UPI001CBBD641|nr:protease complex subunit PrcB family protein [Schnuerera sp. xch1]MBZ2175015.1 protease complex subunit PrcB family protein [Schnuerera sp. xch1]